MAAIFGRPIAAAAGLRPIVFLDRLRNGFALGQAGFPYSLALFGLLITYAVGIHAHPYRLAADQRAGDDQGIPVVVVILGRFERQQIAKLRAGDVRGRAVNGVIGSLVHLERIFVVVRVVQHADAKAGSLANLLDGFIQPRFFIRHGFAHGFCIALGRGVYDWQAAQVGREKAIDGRFSDVGIVGLRYDAAGQEIECRIAADIYLPRLVVAVDAHNLHGRAAVGAVEQIPMAQQLGRLVGIVAVHGQLALSDVFLRP